jgi:hypothetical protein
MASDLPGGGLSELFGSTELDSASLSAGKIRKACIDELTEHYEWYERSKSRYGRVWRISTLIVICLSGVTTVAVASGVAGSENGRIYFGAISALTTALSSVLAAFATQEIWQLRESGRIAISDLLARACLIGDDSKTAIQDAVRLMHEAHQIEEAQARGHFGFLAQESKPPKNSSGPATNQVESP